MGGSSWPTNSALTEQRTYAGGRALPASTGSAGGQQASNSGSPQGVSFSPVTLSVANLLGKPSSLDSSVQRFLPTNWYRVQIRKGNTAPWVELSFPNVTAQDVLDTYSESPGRRIVRVKRPSPDYPARDVNIVGEDLKKSIVQLIADAEAEGEHGLVLVVRDS